MEQESIKMRPREYIKIRGANEHNLKNIDVDIPRNELVVLTGLSGSGKSSLAFDTIYAEGQRRYMESLSSYARQFLGQMEKPNVEKIEGLSPAISIDQKSTNRNPRSTVGTVTEIYDYFRLLYARIGIPHCPKCGKEIKKQSVDQMVDQIMALPEGSRIQLLAPVVRGRKGEHVKVLERARRSGYVRVRVDGSLYELTEEIKLDKNIKHNIEIVVDRLVVKPGIDRRLADSIESVLALTEGLLFVDVIGGEAMTFSQSFSCPDCGISIDEIEPRSFSFNNPFGACPDCYGLGYKMEFDEDVPVGVAVNEAVELSKKFGGDGSPAFVNGILGTICIGAVVSSFFTGNPFTLGDMNQVTWQSAWRGLEVLFSFTNLCLGFSIFFLARTLAVLYFLNNIDNDAIYERSRQQVVRNSLPFVILFVTFLILILCKDGYGIQANGDVALVPYKYFHNLLEMPLNTTLLVIGIAGVLFGIIKTILHKQWRKGINI